MMKERKYATPFSLLHAVSLLSHRSRIEKFSKAITKHVNQQSYVIDIGTGTGVLAMLAARAGARKVTAIDVNPESVRYARSMSERNGLSDRITFIESHYSEFVTDERANVVICEMLSSMMFVEQQVPACRYALNNLLHEQGKIIPMNASVYVVPVEAADVWDRFELHDLRFIRMPQTVNKNQTRDLSDAAMVTRFDFMDSDSLVRVDQTLSFEITNTGVVHGISGMFEANIDDDISLKMEDGWRDLFVPLNEPLKVKAGQNLTLRLNYTPGEFDSFNIEVE
ncbi:MAG: 50S ribosomal protein L11 methyltransferase [Candidatus Thorarchaeota archaeon]